MAWITEILKAIIGFFSLTPAVVPATVIEPQPLPLPIQDPEPSDVATPIQSKDSNMFMSAEKKRVIQSILSVFETGSVEPDYGAVCVLDDGAGITYGKHQSTDRGNALDLIVMRYIDKGGKYAGQLAEFLIRLDKNETSKVNPDSLPSWVVDLMSILRDAGNDPIMHECQDAVFDVHYWAPAMSQAADMGLEYPLSRLICYDSTIHSGPSGISRIRRKFPESPPSGGGDEKKWAIAFLNKRREWLAANSNPVVQNTVYRIDAMLDMVANDNWNLDIPLHIEKPRATII